MKKKLTLVVLAGGIGKRFWPFSTNKTLFPFLGKPLFAASRIPKEVTHMAIVSDTGSADTFRHMETPIPKTVVVQPEAAGMADAVLSTKQEISGGSVIILIADDVAEPGVLDELVAKATSTGAFGVLVGWKPPAYFPGGYLRLAADRVTAIVEKPGAGNEPSPYITMVAQYIEDADALISEISRTESSNDDVYEKSLTALMKDNTFVIMPYHGRFASLKYPWHVLDVMDVVFQDLKSYKGKNVVIKENVILEGPVYIEDGVKIFENTKIVGPCYIGKNTIIGNNNIIRHSHIGAECVTGFNTDVTRSYIGDNCWFHSNYIGDSVLEGNVSMGSGSCLANLRLDDGEIKGTGRTKLGAMVGKGVRIGVNASIMPGVKIGNNSFVGAGVVLDRDLPDQSFCMAKPGYEISKNKKTASRSRDTFKQKI